MKRHSAAVVLASLLALAPTLIACSSPAPAITPTAASKPTAAPPTAGSPAASPAAAAAIAKPASPSASPSAAAVAKPAPTLNPNWQAEWDQTVAAARREGTITISGQPSEVWRRPLTSFEQDYPGISVEYTGTFARDWLPKVYQEREAGQYLWDMRVGGTDALSFQARDRGVLDPVRPLLLLPDIIDESKWIGGYDGLFDDNAKEYMLSFHNYLAFGVYVNRDVIPESELGHVKDILDPKWKGKISLQDPRGAAGLAHLSVYLYLFGEDFIRDLFTKQDVVVTSDTRQQTEWAVRNRYPIGVGLSDAGLAEFREQGLGQNVRSIREAGTVSTGTGGIQLVKNRPHPNATKVYVNWLLSKDVQERVATSVRTNSRRTDVPVVIPENAPEPARIKEYVANQTEDFVGYKNRVVEIANELLK